MEKKPYISFVDERYFNPPIRYDKSPDFKKR